MPDSKLADVVRDIHTLAAELQFYERKYSLLGQVAKGPFTSAYATLSPSKTLISRPSGLR